MRYCCSALQLLATALWSTAVLACLICCGGWAAASWHSIRASTKSCRASLDGDGEWAELGGFAPSPDADLVSACGVLWAWAGTCVCAWRAWVRVREMRIDESAVLSILDNMERDANMEAGV